MERYLYFTNPDSGAPDASAELAMYPASAVAAMFATTATTTTINLTPSDGAGTAEDIIVLTHADGDHKAVMDALVSMINAQGNNNNPFQVVADKENSIFNIAGVTNAAITLDT